MGTSSIFTVTYERKQKKRQSNMRKMQLYSSNVRLILCVGR